MRKWEKESKERKKRKSSFEIEVWFKFKKIVINVYYIIIIINIFWGFCFLGSIYSYE